MAKGILIALTNPVSTDREDEMNEWYNVVHGNEVTSLKGFAGMTRYRAAAQPVPPSEPPMFRYLALYDLDDVDQALKSLQEGAEAFSMSDSVDLEGAQGIAFVKIFSTHDQN